MSLKLGNDDVTKVMLGGQEVSAVYKGTEEVWSSFVEADPIEDINDVFSTYVYKGTGAALDIDNGIDLAGEGGLVWIKDRDNSRDHALFDTERGINRYLNSNQNYGESQSGTVTSYNEGGFSLSGNLAVNGYAFDYVSWTFRKSPKFLDVLSWDGDGVDGRSISHDLGVTPGFAIIKRVRGGTNWLCRHSGLNENQFIWLDENTAAQTATSGGPNGEVFAMNDRKLTFNNNWGPYTNSNNESYAAYLFAHDDSDESVIKCGTYSHVNGTNTEIDLGWKPQFVIDKSATVISDNWYTFDLPRGFYESGVSRRLNPNTDFREANTGRNWTDTGFVMPAGVDTHEGIYIAIKAPPPPPPGPWGTEAMSGKRSSYFEMQKAGVTFPTDNFTVETWFKSFGGPNHGSYASIFGAWSHPPVNGWMVGYNMNNNDSTQDISVMHQMHNDTYEYAKITNNAMTSWTHFAMVKTGGQLMFYVNGTKVKTISAGSYTWGGHTQFYCGGSGIRDAAFGTYSNFRISNIARYSASFNVPASHFEPDANTLVLAHYGPEFKDYSGNNVNMEAGGGCVITNDSPWTARDTYSQVANAQIKREKAKELKETIRDKRDDS